MSNSDVLFSGNLNTGMDFLEKKDKITDDGLLRLNLNEVKDKKNGRKVVLRFLPNLKKDGTVGQNAIEKLIHYVNLKNHDGLSGYYDSLRNFDESCPLTNLYWELKNSNNAAENEKAKLISRSTKYYSYVLVLEDEEQPENEGKIFILQYGVQIKQKIEQELSGEITGDKVNIFDLANGKDFVLILKEKGGFPNYESSTFRPKVGALTINGKTMPTETNDNGVNVIPEKFRDKIKDFLLKRTADLEQFEAKPWDSVVESKVNKIVGVLTGNVITNDTTSENISQDDFFGDDSNDDLFEDAEENTSAPADTSSDSEDDDDFFDSI